MTKIGIDLNKFFNKDNIELSNEKIKKFLTKYYGLSKDKTDKKKEEEKHDDNV